MARALTSQQVFEELHDHHSATVARAFRKAIEELADGADERRVIQLLEIGDVDGAVAALNIEEAAYAPVLDALEEAYSAGGEAASAALPATIAGAALVYRFNRRAPGAAAWLVSYTTPLARHLATEQVSAARTSVLAGLARGDRPSTIAKALIGMPGRATAKRAGGVLGITEPQAVAADKAFAELTSDDPADKRRYLERKRRDKRYDAAVKCALAEAKPVPAALAKQAVADYRMRLAELRSTLIGRKEALAAIQAGKHEAFQQVLLRAALPVEALKRRWRTVGDENVRHTHAAMRGQVVGLFQPFRSPAGALLMFPGDPSAPSSETTGCRCDVVYSLDTKRAA